MIAGDIAASNDTTALAEFIQREFAVTLSSKEVEAQLIQQFGGELVYIRKCPNGETDRVYLLIREDYRQLVREMCRKHHITERTLYRIIHGRPRQTKKSKQIDFLLSI